MIIPEIRGATRNFFDEPRLGEQEGVKLVHEPVVQRGKIFEAVRTVLFESLEEKYLGARIQLLEEAAQLGHAVTAGRNAEYVVDQTFDELLLHILADKQSVWNLA